MSCFNSILVQLEVDYSCPPCTAQTRFNSILVQLEGLQRGGSGVLLSRFNSILVQLEVGGDPSVDHIRVVSIPYWCN